MSIQVAGAATVVVPRDAQPYNAESRVQEVLKATESRTVPLPDGELKDVELLVVRSDAYDEKLTLRTSRGGKKAKGGKRIALTEPLILTRTALALLGSAPKSLEVENNGAKSAAIDVLVYRRTPQPAPPKAKRGKGGKNKPK